MNLQERLSGGCVGSRRESVRADCADREGAATRPALYTIHGMSFAAFDVPRGLAHKGEDGINLDALMRGVASGSVADETSASPSPSNAPRLPKAEAVS